MKVLVDTHVVLWRFLDDPLLSKTAHRTIRKTDNEVFVSAASGWELAIENKSGKLDAEALLDRLEGTLMEEGFQMLPISMEHALRAGSLELHHEDPFDRMLISQAQAENLPILSNDAIFDRYAYVECGESG